MKIISVYADHFGILTHYKKNFDARRECVFQNNGTGKTTLAAFISAMLYGFESGKKTKSLRDRERYAPWSGGGYGGALEVEKDGRRYRIERTFGTSSSAGDELRVIDLTAGKETAELGEVPGETLLGFGKEAFYRTAFLSPASEGAPGDILSRITKSVNGDEDEKTFENAIAQIDKARKELKADRGSKGKIEDLELSLESAMREKRLCETAYENAERLSSSIAADKEKLKEINERITLCHRLETQAVINAAAADFEEKTEKAQKELDEFIKEYGARRASPEELQALSEHLEALRDARGRQNEEPFSQEDSDEFARLSEAFDEQPLTDEALAFAERKAAEKEKYRAVLESKTSAELVARYESLDRHFHGSAPTDEEIEQLKYLCADYENAEKERAERQNAAKGRRNVTPPGLLTLLMAGCFLLSTIVTTVLIATGTGAFIIFLILALAFLGAAVAAYFLKDRKRRRIEDDEAEKAEESYEKIKKSLGEKVGIYQYDKSDLPLAAAALCEDRKEYLQLRERLEADRKRSDAARAGYAEASEELSRFFAAYPDLPEAADDEEKLSLLRNDRAKYIAFTGVASRFRAQLSKSKEDAVRAKKAFWEILTPCGYTGSGMREEEALMRERSLAGEMMRLKARFEQRASDEKEYKEKNPGDPALISLTYNPGEITRLKAENEDLEAAIAASAARLDEEKRVSERADEISRTIDKLREARNEARERYSILSLTKKYLEDAEARLLGRYTDPIKNAYIRFANEIDPELSRGVTILPGDASLCFERAGKLKKSENFCSSFNALSDICFRLALLETVYEKDLPFLILDDPFVYLDDGNTARALELLKNLSAQTQIIYLTCHSSRSFG